MDLCRNALRTLGASLIIGLGFFSGALAQIIELGTTYVALALDLDARDQRRVRLKCAFDTLAAGNLAHHKRRIQTAIALGDYHSLERLHALAFAFYNADADDDGIAR